MAAICLVGVCHLCAVAIEVGQCLCAECREVFERQRGKSSAVAERMDFAR